MAFIDFFNSQGYRVFSKRLLLMSSVVIILGAIMLLTHTEGGLLVTCLGVLSVVDILVMKVLEIIVKHNN